jgi:hypothetical protein
LFLVIYKVASTLSTPMELFEIYFMFLLPFFVSLFVFIKKDTRFILEEVIFVE